MQVKLEGEPLSREEDFSGFRFLESFASYCSEHSCLDITKNKNKKISFCGFWETFIAIVIKRLSPTHPPTHPFLQEETQTKRLGSSLHAQDENSHLIAKIQKSKLPGIPRCQLIMLHGRLLLNQIDRRFTGHIDCSEWQRMALACSQYLNI